jgi:PAS domain-containing protein
MNTRHIVDDQLVGLVEELHCGRQELEAMTEALEQARAELELVRGRLAQGSAPSDAVREALALVIRTMDRPAMLVDDDLWVVAGNDHAATALGITLDELRGSSLTRWPQALERTRAVREALRSHAGSVSTDHAGTVVSFGPGDALNSERRLVLVLLDP